MKTFGELLKQNRLKEDLPLRKVAARLDIDTSILSKIERGERKANKSIVIKAAEIFELDERKLLTEYYSDIVAEELYQEKNAAEILSVAESKIKYLKSKSNIQKQITFEDEE